MLIDLVSTNIKLNWFKLDYIRLNQIRWFFEIFAFIKQIKWIQYMLIFFMKDKTITRITTSYIMYFIFFFLQMIGGMGEAFEIIMLLPLVLGPWYFRMSMDVHGMPQVPQVQEPRGSRYGWIIVCNRTPMARHMEWYR